MLSGSVALYHAGRGGRPGIVEIAEAGRTRKPFTASWAAWRPVGRRAESGPCRGRAGAVSVRRRLERPYGFILDDRDNRGYGGDRPLCGDVEYGHDRKHGELPGFGHVGEYRYERRLCGDVEFGCVGEYRDEREFGHDRGLRFDVVLRVVEFRRFVGGFGLSRGCDGARGLRECGVGWRIPV